VVEEEIDRVESAHSDFSKSISSYSPVRRTTGLGVASGRIEPDCPLLSRGRRGQQPIEARRLSLAFERRKEPPAVAASLMRRGDTHSMQFGRAGPRSPLAVAPVGCTREVAAHRDENPIVYPRRSTTSEFGFVILRAVPPADPSLVCFLGPLPSHLPPVPPDRRGGLGTDSEEKAAASIEIGRFDSSQIADARYVLGVGAGITERPLVERPHRVGVSRLVSSDP
jgi:hypothetical protein